MSKSTKQAVSPEGSSEPHRDSWIKETTPKKVKSPTHTSTSKYDRSKHSVPGRSVFDMLAAHHETNPTPRKSRKTSVKLSPWEQTQERLTLAWLNSHTQKRGLKVNNLEKDLSDGLVLITLIEILSDKPFTKKYKKHTSHRIQQLDNMEVVLETLKEEGLRLISMNAADLVDGNIKLMLGLFSELFYHYHMKVTTAETSVSTSNRAALLEWFQVVLPDCHIINLTTSWNDGLALSALVNYCKPGLIPNHASLLRKNRLKNITNAMEIAEKELAVPQT